MVQKQINDLVVLPRALLSTDQFAIDTAGGALSYKLPTSVIQTYVNANALIGESQVTNLTTHLAARPTFSGTPTPSNLAVWDTGTDLFDSGITVDHSQNMSGVGTLNGFTIANWVVKTNNLSDLSNITIARTNLSVPKQNSFNGNPNGNVAGAINDLCQDTSLNALYMCTTAGVAAAAVWMPVLNLTGVMFRANNLSDVQSKTASFNTISPLTTKGDLLVFNGTNNIRLAGSSTDNFVLTYDSTQASGIKWAPVPAPGTDVRIISTDTVLTSSDFGVTIICEGSTSYTVTLPLAADGTNQFIYFIFNTQPQIFVQINTQIGDTLIGVGSGTTNYKFGTGEYLQLMCDGSSAWLPSATLQDSYFYAARGATFSSSSTFAPILWDDIQKANMAFNGSTGVLIPQYPGWYEITVTIGGPTNTLAYNQQVGFNIVGVGQIYSSNTVIAAAGVPTSITMTATEYFSGAGTGTGPGTFVSNYQNSASLSITTGASFNQISIKRLSNY